MKKLICIIFILILTTPVFAEDFSLTKSYIPKKSPKVDVAFGLLQYSAWLLIDMDTLTTYQLRWNYGIQKEDNPFWATIIDKPTLVFVVDTIIKVGIMWGTSKLYKKNKLLAYLIIGFVNAVEIYCVHWNIRLMKKLRAKS